MHRNAALLLGVSMSPEDKPPAGVHSHVWRRLALLEAQTELLVKQHAQFAKVFARHVSGAALPSEPYDALEALSVRVGVLEGQGPPEDPGALDGPDAIPTEVPERYPGMLGTEDMDADDDDRGEPGIPPPAAPQGQKQRRQR